MPLTLNILVLARHLYLRRLSFPSYNESDFFLVHRKDYQYQYHTINIKIWTVYLYLQVRTEVTADTYL